MIHTRYKKDLAGQLGNLLNRSTAASLLPDGIIMARSSDSVDPRDQLLHDKLVGTAGMSHPNLNNSFKLIFLS
jgi:methionyl-tRNA synthetase